MATSRSSVVCLGAVILSLLCGLAAAQPKVELLWPDGAPGARGTAEGDKPTLTIYLPPQDKATGAAIVICPGGNAIHIIECFRPGEKPLRPSLSAVWRPRRLSRT